MYRQNRCWQCRMPSVPKLYLTINCRFLGAYNKHFSITGCSKDKPSTVLHKIFSPGLHIWEERGQGNNRGKKYRQKLGGYKENADTPLKLTKKALNAIQIA